MKLLTSAIARFFVFSALFAVSAFANITTLDTTFNGTGYRLQQIGTGDASAYSMVVQPDDKIILAGMTRLDNDPNRFALLRLNADGTPDASFGTDGVVFTPAALQAVSWDPKVLLQPDGKILLGATTFVTAEQTYKFIVFRFTAEGVLDPAFNGTGYATANFPASFWDICNSVALGSDGKIVLVGQALTTPGQQVDWDLAVARFTTDGQLDTTFDGDGVIKIGTATPDEEAHSVMVQADGKIIVGGRETTDRERFLLTRLNTDGTIDTSFASNGWNIFQIDFTNNNFTSLARQSDGRILAGGGGKIMRFSTDGVRDMGFAGTGVQYGTGSIETVDIRVIAGDKFLVATRYGLRRFMSNGAQDTHFGSAGFFAPGTTCYTRSAGVQSNGKPILGGVCTDNIGGLERFGVGRFNETRTKRFLDFNGDERTDISIYRPLNGQWWYLESSTLFYQIVAGQFGTPNDIPVPADFTGDGKADVAVWRPSTGEWYVLRSDNGSYYSFPFGSTGDIPIVGDFDDDQLADAGIFRPSTNEWYIQRSSGGLLYNVFGTAGDKPVMSDYDGDLKTDIAVYRPSSGEWWILRSSDGGINVFQFGSSSDKPVPGDYTGDSKTDAAFYRPQTGEWFVLRSEDFSYFSLPFGLSDDVPTPGNFAGDGRFDFVVFRPSTNRWHILPSGGSYFYKDFGSLGDLPLPGIATP